MGTLKFSLKANDYSNPNYIGSIFRKKRFIFFERKLDLLPKPISLLDIGGTVRFWADESYHKKDVQITVLNLREEKSPYENIKVVLGDACDLSCFKDKSFDVSFSNSLIEHLHTKKNQIKMASEAMRVGKYFFVQTPNRYFPIEPHFKFPFFQFLPKEAQMFLQTRTSLINGTRYEQGYAENIINEIKLLSRKEVQELFPKSEILVEHIMGFAKSFMLHNFPKAANEYSSPQSPQHSER